MDWNAALGQMFAVLQPTLVAVLTAVLIALGTAAIKRLGISTDERTDARLKDAAETAARMVEEQVRAAIARGASKPSGAEKLQMATAAVVEKLEVPNDEARDAVMAALPGLTGIGAVKEGV
jgi:hypothetical protein